MDSTFGTNTNVTRLPSSTWMIERYVSDEPILAMTQRSRGLTDEPCVSEYQQGRFRHYGTGIAPSDHPHAGPRVYTLSTAACGRCSSQDVLVLLLDVGIKPRNGDVYYSIELRCRECGAYTAVLHDDA